jgi:hypothetical protein
MSQQRDEKIETWILECFKKEEAELEHQPSFRRLFFREIEQINRDFRIDVFTDYATLVDSGDPDLGTCRESVEQGAHEAFQCYKSERNKGHGFAYCESYSYDFFNNGEDDDRASQDSYRAISNGYGDSHDNPAYIDAYEACLHQKRTEEFARRCAAFVVADDMSFSGAVKMVEDYEVDCQRLQGQGRSGSGSQLNSNGFLQQLTETEESIDEFEASSKPDFKHMSEAEFRIFHAVTEEDNEAWEAEAEYRMWCDDVDVNPLNPGSRAQYKEQEGKTWDDMDGNDSDGWTDNMNKD